MIKYLLYASALLDGGFGLYLMISNHFNAIDPLYQHGWQRLTAAVVFATMGNVLNNQEKLLKEKERSK